MSKRLLLAALFTSAVAMGCTESTAPTIDEPPVAHHLQWDLLNGSPDFSARASDANGEIQLAHPGTAAFSAEGTPETYSVSFWAVKGQDRVVDIDYLDDNGGSSPFLRFEVPAAALSARPNGQNFAAGDSVLITMSLDSLDMVVNMSPSGLQFNTQDPAVLKVWYTGAGEDLNNDGVVDNDDWNIEQNLLAIWTQQVSSDPWSVLPSVRSPDNKWVMSDVEHFSEYAVSW